MQRLEQAARHSPEITILENGATLAQRVRQFLGKEGIALRLSKDQCGDKRLDRALQTLGDQCSGGLRR